MKGINMLTILVLALGLMAWQVEVSEAVPMGTAFTYQGRLLDANDTAEGEYDFQFKLFDAPNGGVQQGNTIDINNVDVIDGYFTVELDFGSDVFNGDARWLETAVRPGDSNDPNAFVTLIPRQEVTPTPYALQTRGIFVDDSGNVGIGTKFPNKKLTIQYGDFAVYPGHEASIITDGFNVKLGDSDGMRNQVFLEIDDLTEKFVFNNGNVGIGTESPTRDLHIYRDSGPAQIGIVTADTSTKAQVIFGDGGGNKWTISSDNTDDKLHFRSGHASGTPRVTFQQDGNVGIGTTNPSEKLEVEGNIDVSSNRVKRYHGFPRPDYDSGWQAMSVELNLQHNIGDDPNNYVVDLQFKDTNWMGLGVNQAGYGGDYYGPDPKVYELGVYWNGLTDTEIKVKRQSDNTSADYIRVRIWVYN